MPTPLRALAAAVLVVLAVVLQTTWLAALPLPGAVPELVLVTAVAIGLAAGPGPGAVAGFAGGLCLDVAPPSVVAVGSTALVLTAVGYAAGTRQRQARESRAVGLGVVALASVAAAVLTALTGLALDQQRHSVADLLALVPTAVVYDVVLALAVLPLATALVARPRRRSVFA